MGIVDDNVEMDSNKETSLTPKDDIEREWSNKDNKGDDQAQTEVKGQGHQDQNDNGSKMNKKEEEVEKDGQGKEGQNEIEARMEKKEKEMDNRDAGIGNDHSKQGQDDIEERMKKKEAEIERANAAEANASMPMVYHDDPGSGNEMEMKFIPENKHLRGASFTTNSRGGTPNTARKRRHHNHHHGHTLEEINMAELISLSGLESICTMSNYDAMSTKDFDVDEEMGDVEGEEEEKGIGVHHVVAVILALASVAVILLLFFLVPCPCEPADWDVEMESMVSKSPVRLLDVNRDGMEDIIFGYGNSMDYAPIEDMELHCQSMNVSSPCGGGVMALSGWRGETIWELPTNQTITGLVCNQLDTNGDGQKDCLASGFDGQLLAIDSKTGTVLWTADQSVTVPTWSYYQPQTLPRDLDGDGVLDLVVTHGPETSSDQGPGRLMLISGQTGKALGSFLEMPDTMATRCPPVIYQQNEEEEDDIPYIIFGSGSFSTQGSMWMISLDHLFCQVTGSDCSEVVLQYDQPIRGSRSDHVMSSVDEPVVELVSGSGSGYDLPAVIADLSQDGINDIITVSHGALVTAVNGSDLQPLWSVDRYVGSYQVTSVPAPGHFDSDEVPDILLHLTPLDSSADMPDKIVILNGTNGAEMWATLSMGNDISPLTRYSPLSLRADEDKDAFAFWVSSIVDIETTTQSAEDGCSDFSLSMDSLSLLIMDRDLVTSPSVLFSTSSYMQSINSSDSTSTGQVTTPHPITTLGTNHMTSSASEGHSPTTVVDITTVVGSQSDTPSPSSPNTSSPQPTNPSMTPTLATQTASTSMLSSGTGGGRRRRNLGDEQASGCYRMMPVITSTGVIGDFDDDGSLELIILINTMPLPVSADDETSNTPMTPTTTILRFGLEEALGLDQRLDLVQEDTFLGPGLENTTVTGDLQDHFRFKRIGEQPWMGYMGSNGDSVYSLT